MLRTIRRLLVLIVPCSLAAQVPKAPLPHEAQAEVLILGTLHLTALGGDIAPRRLATVHDRLAGWRPDVVAVEAMPPVEIERLDLLARHADDAAAAEILSTFARGIMARAHALRESLGLGSRSDAEAGLAALALDAESSAATRRRAAALMVAALDEPSAVLQWSYLAPEERRGGDGITEEIAAALDSTLSRPNEKWLVAVPVARRLGLQRLASIDDHVDDEVGVRSGLYAVLGEELPAAPALQAYLSSPAGKAQEMMLAAAKVAPDLWPTYVLLNDSTTIRTDVEGQWHLFYRTALPSGADRQRVALWEQRNLNIAGRIRAAAAPTGRTLVVIGAAHTPFLAAYLQASMDIRVVPFQALESPSVAGEP